MNKRVGILHRKTPEWQLFSLLCLEGSRCVARAAFCCCYLIMCLNLALKIQRRGQRETHAAFYKTSKYTGDFISPSSFHPFGIYFGLKEWSGSSGFSLGMHGKGVGVQQHNMPQVLHSKVTLHCYDTEERVRCFPIGSASMIRTHSVPWKCAYRTRILHGMVMLTWVGGGGFLWGMQQGELEGGARGLYVPGTCL